jgi:hypothetical protein
MQLDSARELKSALAASVLPALAEPPRVRAMGLPAGPMPESTESPRTLALGIAPKARGDYQLAVRLQRRALEGSPAVEAIRARARGEVDVRYVGRLVKRAAVPWQQKRMRPLRPGLSIGHFRITAGTLGGFVRARAGGEPLILSNNHVLADENRARKGDAVLQPGRLDNGAEPGDVVGALGTFVRLRRAKANLLDCALATITEGIEFEPAKLRGIGQLTGLGDVLLREGTVLAKAGRTTGPTRGRVTAIELDNLLVGYDLGDLRFDGQVEIEGEDDDPFSAGGDSGSLIVDEAGRAVALLFAGGDQGGANGRGLTYANPLRPVLDALKVDLLV